MDISKVGISATLTQIKVDKKALIALYSSTLNDVQRNYSTTNQELLSVVSVITNFRHFLLGEKFILRTDYQVLVYLTKDRDKSSRLFRWVSYFRNMNLR